MKVPFLNLKRLNLSYKNHLKDRFEQVLDSGTYLLGENVSTFEENFARYCETEFCTTVGSGLDALEFILKGYDIGIGDEVLVSAHTFIATWHSIVNVGAKPVPVEPQQGEFNLDPEQLESKINSNTKAIVVAHMYGEPCEMKKIVKVANKYNIRLIEDAAQAHGATYNGTKIGSFGDAAAFSFYPGKNLGALGDGGAVTSNDATLIRRVELFRNYGSVQKYVHQSSGRNSRLDEIQASFLIKKLSDLDEKNAKRNELADFYLTRIDNKHLKLPKKLNHKKHVWHLFVLRTVFRDQLQSYLCRVGIDTIIHYPIPIHQQTPYIRRYKDISLPLSEEIAKTVLSIPMDPLLSEKEAEYVVEILNNWNPEIK